MGVLVRGGIPFYVYMPPLTQRKMKTFNSGAVSTPYPGNSTFVPLGSGSSGSQAQSSSGSGLGLPSFEETGLPESYRDLYNANPALAYQYQTGLWDRIGNIFGFRTSEDRTREQKLQEGNEYIAQLQALAREEAYNSEQSQSERMKAAGVNPALAGVNPSQASEMTESSGVNPDNNRSNFDDVAGIFGSVSQAVNTIIGLASGMQSLSLGKTQNILARFGLGKDVLGFGKDLSTEYKGLADALGLFGDNGQVLSSTDTFSKLKRFGFSEREARRYNAAFRYGLSYADTIAGQNKVIGNLNELSDKSKTYVQNRGAGVQGTEFTPAAQEAFELIGGYSMEVMKLQSKYQAEYYDIAKGALAGRAENAEFKAAAERGEKFSEYGLADLEAAYQKIMLQYDADMAKLNSRLLHTLDTKNPVVQTLLLSGVQNFGGMLKTGLSFLPFGKKGGLTINQQNTQTINRK